MPCPDTAKAVKLAILTRLVALDKRKVPNPIPPPQNTSLQRFFEAKQLGPGELALTEKYRNDGLVPEEAEETNCPK